MAILAFQKPDKVLMLEADNFYEANKFAMQIKNLINEIDGEI